MADAAKNQSSFHDYEIASGITSHIRLPGTTNHNGTSEIYGWVSFEVPVKATVKIQPSEYFVGPNVYRYRWIGLFDNQCTGRAIATANYTPNAGNAGSIEMVLEAGTYKLAIHDKDVSYYLMQVTYTPVEEYQPDPTKKEHVGGKTSHDNILLLNGLDNPQNIYTLHLTHALSWKGKAQRYGWYSFLVREDKTTNIWFDASKSGGSWIGIYNKNGTRVADKWAAAGTRGEIEVDLPKGIYKFFINKSGDDIANVVFGY
jgi:hypothetical protein